MYSSHVTGHHWVVSTAVGYDVHGKLVAARQSELAYMHKLNFLHFFKKIYKNQRKIDRNRPQSTCSLHGKFEMQTFC